MIPDKISDLMITKMMAAYYNRNIRTCWLSFSGLFFGVILLPIINSRNVIAAPFGKFCVNVTYDPAVDRAYQANLNSLLSALSSHASRATNNEFYNTTAELGGSDAVYGLYLCRGDVSRDECQGCVQTASGEILNECPNDKVAIVWYDNCLLRYSNTTDFPQGLFFLAWNQQKSNDPVRYNDYVGNMMNDVATLASSGDPGERFATKEGNFSSYEKLFSLAQCIPDLSSTDCDSCLRTTIRDYLPKCCNGTLGGRVLSSNCYIRYEEYLFYKEVTLPPPPSSTPDTTGKRRIILVTLIVAIAVTILIVAFFCLRRRSRKRPDSKIDAIDGDEITTVESLNCNLGEIHAATDNFNEDRKIGQGGFGSVYKGKLPNGQEVAVKRLSRNSVQGLEEFKNEIVLVATLQHRNLVRLLGFCFEDQERILIYEFVPNRSLDHFLFDPEKQRLLDWSSRRKIIGGIARGLLYLHEDSQLRIIHRDLKASNVLLDENMNPKIADFGTAKLLQVDQSEQNTSKIAGTYGYMAPEYALHGQISVKSDVFSFGVLLLEIISGKQNSTFFQSNGVDDLLSHAWKNLRNGTPLALLDPSVGESYARNEVIQCIHIALLCVQDDVERRPTMASVGIMLNSNSATLPRPLQPPFFYSSRGRTENMTQPEQADTSTTKSSSPSASVNDTSITELYPR